MEKKCRELIELKGLMRERKYLYNKMADILGIHTTTFSDKINGKSVFTLPEAEKIIHELGIEISQIPRYFF